MTTAEKQGLYDDMMQAALTLADLVDGNVTPDGTLDWGDDLQEALDDYRDAYEAYHEGEKEAY